MIPTARAAAALAGVFAATVSLVACGAADQEGAAGAAAVRFTSSVTSRPAAACELLAPQTRKELEDAADRACRTAIAGEEIPADRNVVRAQVGGTARRSSWSIRPSSWSCSTPVGR